MTPKERVHAALRRTTPAGERVPVFLWFHPRTAARLATELEVPASALAEALGDDVRMTWVNNNYAMEGIVHEHEGETHVDDWGITWRKEGEFNQPLDFPLRGKSGLEMDAYRFPEGRVDFLLGLMKPVLAQAGTFFTGCDVSPCAFEMYWRLRGMEDAMMDIAGDPETAGALLAKCARFALQLSRRACVEMPIDMLWTGDDVAGQQCMVMSPESWRALIKPHLAKIFAEGKKHGRWVAYHCCGALRPIIADLVEIGLDLLNPVQSGCPGMDPGELKAEFGERLAFMGGLDTQKLLPFATAAEVRRETEKLIGVMTAPVGGRGPGGYILAGTHTVPPETPTANIFAIYEAAGISREEIMDRASEIRGR